MKYGYVTSDKVNLAIDLQFLRFVVAAASSCLVSSSLPGGVDRCPFLADSDVLAYQRPTRMTTHPIKTLKLIPSIALTTNHIAHTQCKFQTVPVNDTPLGNTDCYTRV